MIFFLKNAMADYCRKVPVMPSKEVSSFGVVQELEVQTMCISV